MLPYITPFPQHKQKNSDFIKWCHDHLLPLPGWESFAHVQSSPTNLPLHLLVSLPYSLSIMYEPSSKFHIPLSVPLTPSLRYFGVPLYQSLKFINKIGKNITKIHKVITKTAIWQEVQKQINEYGSKWTGVASKCSKPINIHANI